MNVNGQTAIVTGAASGLGAATARALAAAGARVGLIDLNAEALATIATETGGTAAAATKLVHREGGIVAACAVVIELSFLDGRKVLDGCPVISLITYE